MPDAAALTMTEPQARVAPALSATSDMPEVKVAPPPISEETNTVVVPPAPETDLKTDPAATSEGDAAALAAKAAEDATKLAAEEVDPDALPDNTPAWLKKLAADKRREASSAKAQATREANLREAAEKKATTAETNLAKALESLETLTKAQATKLAADIEQTDPRPVREKFDNPDQYDAALVDWAGRRAALATKAEAERSAQDTIKQAKADDDAKAVEAANHKVIQEFSTRRDKFTEEHADYAEVAEAEDVQISIPMAQTIMNDPDGPAIAYYLGKNKDDAARIAALPAVVAIAELGRIAYRLSVKPIVQPKPAPIAPLRAGNEVASRKSPDEMSMAEYAADRTQTLRAQERERRGLAN